MDYQPHIERFRRRFAEVERNLGDPGVFEDQKRSQDLGREFVRLKRLVEVGNAYLKAIQDLEENRSMVSAEAEDSELAEMGREEISRLERELPGLELALREGLLPPDPTDSRNTIIEIRAGAGGDESSLFSADLFRMYSRYAEDRGWKVEPMSSSPSEVGGFKEIIFNVTGEEVYKRLKYESGVHRVQRVPATEASGRIHTSTCTVAVLPEAEEVDLEIRPDELEVSICRASGPGGQGVNTTDSAVQILHKPTGMIVRCADERSQLKNKAKAMTVLRSRLLEKKIADEQAKYAAERKSQVGTGERNERIRTYNFPQSRMTDHRIDLTLYNLPHVIEGDLDPVIDPLLADSIATRLAALETKD
ncbi:MAG: peptide chain release factor 1 [Verrucomicrobiae bacterium]|jgi:peptide chain release factor 1|nr:peptide chain release factor 1 [Verrucomicrobiae bacterium]